MSRVVLIHGWKAKRTSLEVLAGPLERLGYRVEVYSYGRVVMPLSTALTSRQAAKKLAAHAVYRVRPGDIVVGHSNGGAVAWDLSYYLEGECPLMVWLHPALDRHLVPSRRVRSCHVVHSGGDRATWLAKWVPGSRWGGMGHDGYRPWAWEAADPRMVNHTPAELGLPKDGHSSFRSAPEVIAAWIDRWAKSGG